MVTYGDPKDHEISAQSMTALGRHVLLDTIDNAGDYDFDFVHYIPVGATYSDRGCPDYTDPVTDRFDILLRRER